MVQLCSYVESKHKKMKQLEEKVEIEIKVRPALAWKTIASVDGVDKWFSSVIKTCHVEGDRRYCEMVNGAKLEEQLLEINHENRVFRFAIPNQKILPVKNLSEAMKVREGQNGNSIIEWSAKFDSTPENAKIARESLRHLWISGLKEMEFFLLNSKDHVTSTQ